MITVVASALRNKTVVGMFNTCPHHWRPLSVAPFMKEQLTTVDGQPYIYEGKGTHCVIDRDGDVWWIGSARSCRRAIQKIDLLEAREVMTQGTAAQHL